MMLIFLSSCIMWRRDHQHVIVKTFLVSEDRLFHALQQTMTNINTDVIYTVSLWYSQYALALALLAFAWNIHPTGACQFITT